MPSSSPYPFHHLTLTILAFRSPHHLLLRVRQLDGLPLQGPVQLHGAAARPAALADLQRLLRQDGPLL